MKKPRALFNESKHVEECECLEDHARISNAYEYFSHVIEFPWHRLVPKVTRPGYAFRIMNFGT